MTTSLSVKKILAQTLQLGDRVHALTDDAPLLGALPELDSMAVVSLLTALETRFGFVIEDDEISAETFATFGNLLAFVDRKLAEESA
jgi:acyl carrier protein